MPVRFSADDDFNVVLDTDKGHYKMVGHDGADYPALPELSDSVSVETDGALLKRAITKNQLCS